MDVAEASVPIEVTDIVSCPPPARVITAVAYAAAYATDLAVGEIQYMTGRTDDDRLLFGGMFWLADKEVMVTVMLDEQDSEHEATAGVSVEVDGVDVDWSGWFDPVLEEVTSALVAAITNHIKSLSNTRSFIVRLVFNTLWTPIHGHASVASVDSSVMPLVLIS